MAISGSENTMVAESTTLMPPSMNISVIGRMPRQQAQKTQFQRAGFLPASSRCVETDASVYDAESYVVASNSTATAANTASARWPSGRLVRTFVMAAASNNPKGAGLISGNHRRKNDG